MLNEIEKNTKAFSLVEVLVGLIIISIALAAFAPTMNKRVEAQKTALGSRLSDKCTTYGLPSECKLCYGTGQCVVCDLGCAESTLNVSTCTCK